MALCGALGDRHDLDALAHDDMRHVEALDELREPGFEVEAVVEDQVGFRGPSEVAGRRLVAVDLGADLRDGLDSQVIARDLLRDILEHGEGREHDWPLVPSPLAALSAQPLSRQGGRGEGRGDHQKFRHTEILHRFRPTESITAQQPTVSPVLG